MFNAEIYRSYDIRGIVPDEFVPEEAYHIGRAYAEHTGAKSVVVGRDMRPSGDEFVPELIRGLTDSGVDVIRIGQATTPMLYFAVHHFKTDGGIIMTASHNPAEYNGMKMTRAEAVPIAADSGLHDIRDLVEKREWQEVENKGEVSDKTIIDEYIEVVCDGADGVADGLTVVVDGSNGMAGLLLERVWQRLGGNVIPLYWELDGRFPNHEANPLIEDNLKDLFKLVEEHKADLGVAFDGDGDRVAFSTEKNRAMPGDITTALLAKEVLQENPGAKILYDLRASRTTAEYIKENGGEPIITRVGHSFIKANMRKEKAVFAGEVSGHFYFTPWYAESGMMAMVLLLKLLKETGKSMSELVDPLMNRYSTSPELNFEVEDKEGAIDRVEEKYKDDAREVLKLDGLTVRYDDWWLNLRPSGTEPVLRLKVEATNLDLMKEKRKEIEKIIGGKPVAS